MLTADYPPGGADRTKPARFLVLLLKNRGVEPGVACRLASSLSARRNEDDGCQIVEGL
jgi:hypothetical protein